jgi:hypothetical protein
MFPRDFFKKGIVMPQKEPRRMDRTHIWEGQPGFLSKSASSHLYCNETAPDGLARCTREGFHEGFHAAHADMGIEGSYDTVVDPDTGESSLVLKPGAKHQRIMQFSKWS